jgi:hypothetical protein
MLFGHTMWGIRLFDCIWQTICGLLIYFIARYKLKRKWALASAGLYLLAYFSFGYWHTAHVGSFLLPCVLMSVLLHEHANRSNRSWLPLFLSGLWMGLSPWFKPTSLAFVVGLFTWTTIEHWDSQKGPLKRLLIRWAVLGIGVLIPAILIITSMFILGMLQPLLEIWHYSFFSYPNVGITRNISGLWRVTWEWAMRHRLIAFPFLIGVIDLLFDEDRRQEWRGIIILALFGLAAIYAQRRLWDYHWISTLPFMALIATNVLAYNVEKALHSKGTQQKWRGGLLILVCLGLTLPNLRVYSEYYLDTFSYLTGHRSWLAHLETFGIKDKIAVSDYVRERSTDRDYLFVWGHWSMIYYLAERKNPTRFGVDPPLSLSHPSQHTWQQECIQDLRTHLPQYVIVATDDVTPFEPTASELQLSTFPEFAGLLNTKYVYDRRVGSFKVYMQMAPPEHQVEARLGEEIILLGYDLLRDDFQPDGGVSIALHWSAVSQPCDNYTVFVQLVDWSGPEVIAQSDTYPVHSKRPTSGWHPGEHILDTHDLKLPHNLPDGKYEVIAGMYNLETRERLPVTGTRATKDNYISLGKLEYSSDNK